MHLALRFGCISKTNINITTNINFFLYRDGEQNAGNAGNAGNVH